jgi:hypothetical protein
MSKAEFETFLLRFAAAAADAGRPGDRVATVAHFADVT